MYVYTPLEAIKFISWFPLSGQFNLLDSAFHSRCVSYSLSVCLPINPSKNLFILPSIHPVIHPSIQSSICPSIYPSIFLAILPIICPSIPKTFTDNRIPVTIFLGMEPHDLLDQTNSYLLSTSCVQGRSSFTPRQTLPVCLGFLISSMWLSLPTSV